MLETGSEQVVIQIIDDGQAQILELGTEPVVEILEVGPYGPHGLFVDDSSKVDKSVVYYDATASKFKADQVWTIPTLSDGGNF